jgi:serine/threonine protein kinase
MNETSLEAILLSKTGGARMQDVDTLHVLCTDPNTQLVTQSTLKPSYEHVLVSAMRHQPNKQVVVKVHEANNPFLNNELELLKCLAGCRYVVKYICDFTCNDDKKRWKRDPHKLHFIVMEYIRDGDLWQFMKKHANDVAVLKCLFLQVALAICEIGSVYKVYHGDIHSGNILVHETSKSHVVYRVFEAEYKVRTHGFYPVMIDFGRGSTFDKTSKNVRFIIDEVLIALSMFSGWVNNGLKIQLQGIVADFRNHPNKNKIVCIQELVERLQMMPTSTTGYAIGG